MQANDKAIGFHPVAAAFREMLAGAGAMPFETMAIEEARAAAQAFAGAFPAPVQPIGRVAETLCPARGGPVPIRIYEPVVNTPDMAGSGILFLHGGGWVMCGLDSHDAICRALANTAGCPVFAVDYRLAPEHPFPAAHEDAADALAWLVANATRYLLDPARIIVAGDSAGANLALSLALGARAAGVPQVAYQMLFYPVTDLSREAASYARCEEGLQLTSPAMRWMRAFYLPDPQDAMDVRVSPLLEPSLAKVAPAFVLTVEHDPLCDEGRALARRLASEGSGGDVHVHLSGHMHGFLNYGPAWADVQAVLTMACAAARAWLANA